MTLKTFEKRLKAINPRLKLKVRHYGDIIGLYVGYNYVLRMTKGELQMNGYRLQMPNPNDPFHPITGNIVKRGRKTIVNILRSHGWVPNHRDRSKLVLGIK